MLLGKLGDRRDVLEAGVRDHRVEPAEPLERGVDHGAVSLPGGEVAVLDVHPVHRPTVRLEARHDRRTDPAARAGDQRCLHCLYLPLAEAQIAERGEEAVLAPHAVKRLIEPAEVAETVAFLCGAGGSAFTGVPVTMDLGWTAR